jgi:hypothetical protein
MNNELSIRLMVPSLSGRTEGCRYRMRCRTAHNEGLHLTPRFARRR